MKYMIILLLIYIILLKFMPKKSTYDSSTPPPAVDIQDKFGQDPDPQINCQGYWDSVSTEDFSTQCNNQLNNAPCFAPQLGGGKIVIEFNVTYPGYNNINNGALTCMQAAQNSAPVSVSNVYTSSEGEIYGVIGDCLSADLGYVQCDSCDLGPCVSQGLNGTIINESYSKDDITTDLVQEQLDFCTEGNDACAYCVITDSGGNYISSCDGSSGNAVDGANSSYSSCWQGGSTTGLADRTLSNGGGAICTHRRIFPNSGRVRTPVGVFYSLDTPTNRDLIGNYDCYQCCFRKAHADRGIWNNGQTAKGPGFYRRAWDGNGTWWEKIQGDELVHLITKVIQVKVFPGYYFASRVSNSSTAYCEGNTDTGDVIIIVQPTKFFTGNPNYLPVDATTKLSDGANQTQQALFNNIIGPYGTRIYRGDPNLWPNNIKTMDVTNNPMASILCPSGSILTNKYNHVTWFAFNGGTLLDNNTKCNTDTMCYAATGNRVSYNKQQGCLSFVTKTYIDTNDVTKYACVEGKENNGNPYESDEVPSNTGYQCPENWTATGNNICTLDIESLKDINGQYNTNNNDISSGVWMYCM